MTTQQPQTFTQHTQLSRDDLIKYAGASNDYNPIHYNEIYAKKNGLPNVIAHGMLTMALTANIVTQINPDPTAIITNRTKFINPLPIPQTPTPTTITITATIIEQNPQTTTLKIQATTQENTILTKTNITLKTPTT